VVVPAPLLTATSSPSAGTRAAEDDGAATAASAADDDDDDDDEGSDPRLRRSKARSAKTCRRTARSDGGVSGKPIAAAASAAVAGAGTDVDVEGVVAFRSLLRSSPVASASAAVDCVSSWGNGVCVCDAAAANAAAGDAGTLSPLPPPAAGLRSLSAPAPAAPAVGAAAAAAEASPPAAILSCEICAAISESGLSEPSGAASLSNALTCPQVTQQNVCDCRLQYTNSNNQERKTHARERTGSPPGHHARPRPRTSLASR